MIDRVKDYIGWWILIPAIVVVVLQVPSCVDRQNIETTKQIQIMTAHCASQGKTFMLYPNSTDGLCI